jgi:hypothetical protein
MEGLQALKAALMSISQWTMAKRKVPEGRLTEDVALQVSLAGNEAESDSSNCVWRKIRQTGSNQLFPLTTIAMICETMTGRPRAVTLHALIWQELESQEMKQTKSDWKGRERNSK